jgi:hypothetical protein
MVTLTRHGGIYNIMRCFSFTLKSLAVIILSTTLVVAQKPEIKVVDKVNGAMDEVVTLTGSFFGTDATRLAVTFGASKGTIQSVSDQLLAVRIPYGTTYRDISVTNLNTGLIHGGTFSDDNGGSAAQVAVKWLDWQLRGDREAALYFIGADCGLCRDPEWTLERKFSGVVAP